MKTIGQLSLFVPAEYPETILRKKPTWVQMGFIPSQMALVVTLESLQAEDKFPLCLDELTDQVTIQCAHNFSQSCIKDLGADLQGKLYRPVF